MASAAPATDDAFDPYAELAGVLKGIGLSPQDAGVAIAGDEARACARVVKWLTESSSNSRVEFSDSAAALSNAYPANDLGLLVLAG